jgi:hypothetical protein
MHVRLTVFEGDFLPGYCANCDEREATVSCMLEFNEPHRSLFGVREEGGMFIGFCDECWDTGHANRVRISLDACLGRFSMEAEVN